MSVSTIPEKIAAQDLAALLDQAAEGPVVIKRRTGADTILLTMNDLADIEFGARAKQAKENGIASAVESRTLLESILYG